MAVTLVSLRTAHPEFTTVPDAVVQAAIDSATARLESTIYGTLHDDAITWLACYIAVTSPYARDKRRKAELGIPEGYLGEWEAVTRAAARSHRYHTGQTG